MGSNLADSNAWFRLNFGCSAPKSALIANLLGLDRRALSSIEMSPFFRSGRSSPSGTCHRPGWLKPLQPSDTTAGDDVWINCQIFRKTFDRQDLTPGKFQNFPPDYFHHWASYALSFSLLLGSEAFQPIFDLSKALAGQWVSLAFSGDGDGLPWASQRTSDDCHHRWRLVPCWAPACYSQLRKANSCNPETIAWASCHCQAVWIRYLPCEPGIKRLPPAFSTFQTRVSNLKYHRHRRPQSWLPATVRFYGRLHVAMMTTFYHSVSCWYSAASDVTVGAHRSHFDSSGCCCHFWAISWAWSGVSWLVFAPWLWGLMTGAAELGAAWDCFDYCRRSWCLLWSTCALAYIS